MNKDACPIGLMLMNNPGILIHFTQHSDCLQADFCKIVILFSVHDACTLEQIHQPVSKKAPRMMHGIASGSCSYFLFCQYRFDFIQFFIGEIKVFQRFYVIIDLAHSAGADQHACDFPIAENPSNGHLSQCLAASLRDFIQSA